MAPSLGANPKASLSALQRRLARSCTTSYGLVRQYSAQAGESFQAGAEIAAAAARKGAVYVAAVLAIVTLLAALVCWCLILAVASTGALRYHMLSSVPDTHVLPLRFNALPLYTDWWRLKPVDEAVATLLQTLPVKPAPSPPSGMSMTPLAGWGAAPPAHSDLKLSFLKTYMDSVLATSTMLLGTGQSHEVFTPSGMVNMEALFAGNAPLFNAKGEYSAKVQLVFLREEAGRDVSVVLESAMLFAEDSNMPQAVSSLDVLFQHVHTVNVQTGAALLSWPMQMLRSVVRFCLYLPIRALEIVDEYMQDSRAAPFPSINHDREVSVVVPLYHRFTPPMALQPRLRAINFTLYQSMQPGTPSPRVALDRMVFLSTLQLTGLAYFLSTYPLVSFLVISTTLFVLFSWVGLIVVAATTIFVYIRFFQMEDTLTSGGWDAAKDYSFSRPRTSSMVDSSRRNHFESVSLLEASQLNRSSSSMLFSADLPGTEVAPKKRN